MEAVGCRGCHSAPCSGPFPSRSVAVRLPPSPSFVLRRYYEFSGFHGLLAAIVVAVKQVMPEHEAKLFGVIKLTFKASAHFCFRIPAR